MVCIRPDPGSTRRQTKGGDVAGQTRTKMSAQDLASMLIKVFVNAQQVKPLLENLSVKEMQRFATTVRRYQLAGLLLALGEASKKQRTFSLVRDYVEGIEFRGKSESEIQQLRGDLAITTKSLHTLLARQQQNAEFTWARTWYQEIGVDEVNVAVLSHVVMQWLSFYRLVQDALQQFDPYDGCERHHAGMPQEVARSHDSLDPTTRERACMRLAWEMRLGTLQERLSRCGVQPPRGRYWQMWHPFAYRRELRRARQDKAWLEAQIAAIEAEPPPKAPEKKTLYALWDSCNLTSVAIGLDEGASLVSKWIAILYGDDTARRINVLYRAHQVAAEQEKAAATADQVGVHWGFVPPIESLLYQLSSELPEYREPI